MGGLVNAIFGGGDSSPPPPPDPAQVAKLQGEENRKAMQMQLDNSRVNSSNAFGTSNWGQHPTTNADGSTAPNWSLTQTLSPESQGIYNSATAKLNDTMGGFNPTAEMSGLRTDPGLATDPNRYNQNVADAVYSRMRRYQDPADALARTAQQSNLADRGFSVGDKAYETDVGNLRDHQIMGQADSADRAQVTGASQGLNEFGAENNAKLATFNANNSSIMGKLSMQQQIAQAMSGIRNQQVAGVSGLTNSSTTPSMQAPDMVGMSQANYRDQLNANAASNASSDNMFGSLLGTAASIGLAPMTGGGSLMGNFLGGLGGMGGGGSGGADPYAAPSVGGGFGGQPYRSTDGLDSPRRSFYR